ncbi:ribbon-helix-helix domain-containing protein [Natronogracilivirga saccharolytica]|uniref:Ribbon-helix-helix domain-containing protein n=1 Tax=Natronogracilivirga saccharolytica TaxID=2812953 RepID=A0A8J7UV49_9BACT|nr:ribbon-helix-helix domain-containing protein [Natronogracilivirga saccharolytica]MBP3193055.1 ribbon-helix-helix domain-containing protein [Natronogracilivirga saccharolytica]
MTATLSIRINKELQDLLEQTSKRTGKPKSDLVREALQRQLDIESFRQVRKSILPFAEAEGILTENDVWRDIS